jgi:hypothetical protein
VPEGELARAPDGALVLSREQFWLNFRGMFEGAGALTGLQSFPIAEAETDRARATADIFYDLALTTTWLRFLVDPKSTWAGKAFVVGTFVLGKAAAIRAELMARQSNTSGRGRTSQPAGAGAQPGAPAREPAHVDGQVVEVEHAA